MVVGLSGGWGWGWGLRSPEVVSEYWPAHPQVLSGDAVSI